MYLTLLKKVVRLCSVGEDGPKSIFLMMSSQNLTVFGAKVGHRPY
jgi:hypothetical protein